MLDHRGLLITGVIASRITANRAVQPRLTLVSTWEKSPPSKSSSLPPRSIDPRLVYFDPFLLDRGRINAGLAQKQLATKARLAFNTVAGAFRGEGVFPEIAKRIAQLVGKEVLELLAPWDPRYAPAHTTLSASSSSASGGAGSPSAGAAEWETDSYLGPGRLSSNGLHYFVCRMRHRHLPDCSGRGKFYHLSYLGAAARGALRAKLTRHAEVCHRIGPHPQIAVNLSTTPVANEEGWWIIDRWVSAETLATRLDHAPWAREGLPRLMREMAEGLAALHRAEIVFRELAPSRVLIADDGTAVLTDFELAKLLDGDGPSVSADWPEDDYRAPEVEGGVASPQADLFSWGCVFLHAALGKLPPPAEQQAAVATLDLPKGMRSLLGDCLARVPTDRPRSVAVMLKELSRWRAKTGAD